MSTRQAKVQRIVPYFVPSTPRVPLGKDGVAVPREFAVKLALSSGVTVTMEIRVADRRADVTSLTVVESEGRGITGLTVDGLSVSSLLQKALSATAWVTKDPHVSAASEVRRAAQDGTLRRGRRPISPQRLEHIAELIARGGTEAEIDQRIMAAEDVDDRQARRLKKRAREANS